MMNEHALKDRLKVIAAEKAAPMNKIWKQLLLERFLARLSVSPHQNKFIFKGGLLLAQYIVINRETIDLDFMLTKLKAESQQIEKAIKEISAIDTQDGFYFTWNSIAELSQPHMHYSGYRINLSVLFGKMKDKIQIDIGVGDEVSPIETQFFPFEYKGKPIFTGEISLQVYPPESIFSEKLESIISKGAVNSRMKDYHDLILMIRDPDLLDPKKLSLAVSATFKRRNTILTLPITYQAHEIQTLQAYWVGHLRGLGEYKKRLDFSGNIEDLITELNDYAVINITI